MTTAVPPRRIIALWKDASVRSEGFKNNRPSTLPASACGCGICCKRAARPSRSFSCSRGKSARSRKRFMIIALWLETHARGDSLRQAGERLPEQVDVLTFQNERSQDAQHVGVRA